MAILPAWINIVVVLLHVTVIQGAGEPEFAASVPANVLATYDGTPGSSSVTLPCTLSFTDPTIDPQNMEWRVDLTWFKREFGETQTTNLYIWENNYDDRIDMNETRISRVNHPFEERYNLRFNNVGIDDEGEYCCYLHINTNPSSTACTNLHYKAFQDDDAHFIMDCDATDADPKTTTVNCPAVGSSIPPMNVQIKNFYPDIIQSEGRMVELYAPAKDSSNAIKIVESTDFINNADGTFNVNFSSTWPAEYKCDTLGAVTFLISLTHKLEGDETYHTCTWIQQDCCQLHPCLNGGLCSSDPLPLVCDPTCECIGWWTGPHCETCNNCNEKCNSDHGSCDTDNCECVCRGQCTGDTCDDYPAGRDPCGSLSCGEHGRCVADYCDDSAKCVCETNWKGDSCDQNPCLINPCQNGGTCRSKNSVEHECDCRQPWAGKNCTDNPCSINPCENSGTCTSESATEHNCACRNNFGGENCAILCNCIPAQTLTFYADLGQENFIPSVNISKTCPKHTFEIANGSPGRSIGRTTGLITPVTRAYECTTSTPCYKVTASSTVDGKDCPTTKQYSVKINKPPCELAFNETLPQLSDKYVGASLVPCNFTAVMACGDFSFSWYFNGTAFAKNATLEAAYPGVYTCQGEYLGYVIVVHIVNVTEQDPTITGDCGAFFDSGCVGHIIAVVVIVLFLLNACILIILFVLWKLKRLRVTDEVDDCMGLNEGCQGAKRWGKVAGWATAAIIGFPCLSAVMAVTVIRNRKKVGDPPKSPRSKVHPQSPGVPNENGVRNGVPPPNPVFTTTVPMNRHGLLKPMNHDAPKATPHESPKHKNKKKKKAKKEKSDNEEHSPTHPRGRSTSIHGLEDNTMVAVETCAKDN